MNRIFPTTSVDQTTTAEAGAILGAGAVELELPAAACAPLPDTFLPQRHRDTEEGDAGSESRETPAQNSDPGSAESLKFASPLCLCDSVAELSGFTPDELLEARRKENDLLEWRRLQSEDGLSGRAAAESMNRPASWFSQLWAPYEERGLFALLPRRRGVTGAKPQFEVPAWFITAARFFYLPTNRTSASGSVPEAIRCALSLPICPSALVERLKKKLEVAPGHPLPEASDELRRTIFAREREGKPMLPARLMKQIAVREAVVRQHRNPTEAALDLLNAPGSMMWFNEPNGERRFVRAGDIFEADDATINFPVCIPWSIGGCPVSDRYGVKVGRFQWLVAIDVASRFVPGYSYVMRPRSSYRAEDVLALMKMVTRNAGIPRQWRLEMGVWKSHLVQDAIKNMGSTLHTVHSPHQKPFIEGLFNKLWTKLSVQLPDASVGRFRGEEEKASDLLTACQRGHRDPRHHFPMLSEALKAFDHCIADHHRSTINSVQYGRWVPEERWAEQVARSLEEREEEMNGPAASRPSPLRATSLRKLSPEMEWLFHPYVVRRKVTGMTVRTRVPLFEGLSVPFDFSAPWLAQYHRCAVKIHFDPSEPKCFGTIVLDQDWGTQRAGAVLGLAQQINEVASYARFVMSWGDDDRTAGLKARQQAASALRREVRAVLPNGRTAAAVSEQRDGIAAVAIIESGGASRSASAAPVTPEFSNRPSEIEAAAARALRLRELEEFENLHKGELA